MHFAVVPFEEHWTLASVRTVSIFARPTMLARTAFTLIHFWRRLIVTKLVLFSPRTGELTDFTNQRTVWELRDATVAVECSQEIGTSSMRVGTNGNLAGWLWLRLWFRFRFLRDGNACPADHIIAHPFARMKPHWLVSILTSIARTRWAALATRFQTTIGIVVPNPRCALGTIGVKGCQAVLNLSTEAASIGSASTLPADVGQHSRVWSAVTSKAGGSVSVTYTTYIGELPGRTRCWSWVAAWSFLQPLASFITLTHAKAQIIHIVPIITYD